jgi:hypothetical protein
MEISIASKFNSRVNLKAIRFRGLYSESAATRSRPGSRKSIPENPRSEVYERAASMGLWTYKIPLPSQQDIKLTSVV